MKPEGRKASFRCAIYTRVSTEHAGLKPGSAVASTSVVSNIAQADRHLGNGILPHGDTE
jgi:hypothetical protein